MRNHVREIVVFSVNGVARNPTREAIIPDPAKRHKKINEKNVFIVKPTVTEGKSYVFKVILKKK